VLGRVDETERDQVVGRIPALVAGIRPGIALKRAALGAGDVDPIAMFGELPVGMGQLRPPESDRPTRLVGDRRIGGEDEDALGVAGIEDVYRSGHRVLLWATELPKPVSRRAPVGEERSPPRPRASCAGSVSGHTSTTPPIRTAGSRAASSMTASGSSLSSR